MPITVTFDVVRPTPGELTRIRGFFERLGWQHLGNTAYRYPKLHGQHPTEDWFNHVIPALMLLRAFARHAATTGRNIRQFSIGVQSSTGFDPLTNVGVLPLPANGITYSQTSWPGRNFGQQNPEDWIDGVAWPAVRAASGCRRDMMPSAGQGPDSRQRRQRPQLLVARSRQARQFLVGVAGEAEVPRERRLRLQPLALQLTDRVARRRAAQP